MAALTVSLMEKVTAHPTGGVEDVKTLYQALDAVDGVDADLAWIGRDIPSLAQRLQGGVPLEAQRAGYFLEHRRIETYLEELGPDIILTQTQPSYAAVRYAEENDATVVLFLRAYELLYHGGYNRHGSNLASRLANAVIRPFNRHRSDHCLDHADVRVANSGFVRDEYARHAGASSTVVTPPIDPEQYRVEDHGDSILHVNPARKKGIRTTMAVARQMPDQEFLVCGAPARDDIRRELERIDNVTLLGYIDDIRDAYRRSKLVLMPSQWPEPFGRVPIEAGISGIPTICSDRGGLPEAVGDDRLVVREDRPEAYVRTLRSVLDDYGSYADAAEQHAREHTVDAALASLQDAINSGTDRDIDWR